MASKSAKKRRRRFMLRRKRTLDPGLILDYRKPDTLKRFITDRGKIIPRRISGANADQQRLITLAVKRARYLGLLPCSVSHRPERGFAGEMSAATASSFRDSRGPRPGGFRDRDDRPPRRDDDRPRSGGDRSDSNRSDSSRGDSGPDSGGTGRSSGGGE